MRQAVPVPGDLHDDEPGGQAAEAVRQLQALAAPAGAAALTRARELLAERADAVTALTRLRAEVGVELAGPAWGIARQRERARPAFGADADRFFFTADALEQAGRPVLADRRAARLLADGARSVVDLGCAAGTDTIALARAGATVVAVDLDPVARELTRLNTAAAGLTGVEVRAGDAVDLVAAAAGGRVAGCDAAVLDPARRAGGRRQLDPDRWSPPWSTVRALLDAVPTCLVKVAPGLDHDRVPAGVEAEWVSVGGSIVEALLWGRGPSRTWRRATVIGRDGGVRELTADTDPGDARPGPVRDWLHEPDPAVIRSGLVALAAAELDATLVDPTIAYLTSDAAADSPWVSSYRVTEVLPFNLKKLKALLRARGVGRVVVKKRGSPIEPETLARQLRGPGEGSAVVVVTRVAGAPTVLVCAAP
ncbi:class I SAM-dependent methyltransferase [Modestobacter sp. VKM Ac-2983]|uniref:class I SAM-dependent methyltransferase n=1 Tax=Modestobacter sp. VKM Ac-2983 TaxID=3004137 RepID=UPI0022ABA764|nr:class I SAM-dependent methyltransferase [Modestobacter sp. VKM Ac-2983]MCZ2806376.1 class I SAM-dependent methyltransferase [Modestobacter sp. VKM Ac-2983]